MEISISYYTARGKRQNNEDAVSLLEGSNSLLAVVADGLGGHEAGEVASNHAVATLNRLLQAQTPEEDDLIDAIQQANQEIYEMQNAQSHMRTTVAALWLGDYRTIAANVGDSRCYLINSRDIRQLTVDHSLVQMMVDRGELQKSQAKSYPGKNFITRAIGTEPVTNCDIFHRKLQPDDCLLLCSDGLSNLLDDQELLFEVVHGEDKQDCCLRLLNIAKNRGAPDNVTCVLVQD